MRNALIFLSLLICSVSFAQNSGRGYISGSVVEDNSAQPIIQAGVQLLSVADSSLIEGVVTDFDGKFRVKAAPGDYILKVSFIGFSPQYRNIHNTPSNDDLNVGIITLSPESTLLEGAVVKANADPVTIRTDTVVYNAAAYHVADDAMIGDLLKKIPGLEIDEEGMVTLNGREIKQLLLNGKRYFGGDVKTGLKNIPANLIENIAAYDRQSEFSRLTGIDDGEEEPVLDLKVKKSMMDGWRGNALGAYGTSGRYHARLNANKIKDESQSSLIANVRNLARNPNVNNVNRIVTGDGARGDHQDRDAGYTYAAEDKKKKIEAHAQYSGNTRNTLYDTKKTSVYSSSTSYGTGTGTTDINENMFKGDCGLTLKLYPKSTVFIRPEIQYKKNENASSSWSKTFSENPDLLPDPALKQSNSTNNNSRTSTDNGRAKLAAQYVYKYGPKYNSNVSVRMEVTYNTNVSDGLYDNISYKKATSTVSGKPRKQSIWALDNNIATRLQFSTSNPIGKTWRFQTNIIWDYKLSNSDRQVFNLAAADPSWTISQPRPLNYQEAFDPKLSSSGQYIYNVGTFYTGLFYFKKKFTLSAGVNFRPQWGCLVYPEGGERKEIRTFIFRAAPNVNIRFNRLKNKRLQFIYRTWVGNPSLYNLLPVENGTSITTIHEGNPNLKPSMTQVAEFSFNSSNPKKRNSILCNLNYQNISDQASNSSEYDPETGVRTITPKNIDGNWNVTGNFAFNKTFNDQRFSISTHTSAGFFNSMAYLYDSKTKKEDINQATRLMARQTVDAAFRHDWLEVVLNAAGDITDEKSLLRPDLNRIPYRLKGGCSLEVFFPWKMRLGSDFAVNVMRGSAYESFNRNFLSWNAELSQTVLKGKGTVKIEATDILGQQLNSVQNFSSESRSATLYNGVNRTIIAKFIYRFKL